MYNENYRGNDIDNSFIDNTDSFGNVDELISNSFLGIGKRNKQKQGEKKLRKSIKQLEKGHTKAAERKLKKGTNILSNISKQQQGIISLQKLQSKINEDKMNINKTKPVLDSTNVQQTESLSTQAGQIGTEAGSTVIPAESSQLNSGSGGGTGAGDIDSNVNDLPTGELANEKELTGVTVKSKKTNWFLIGIIIFIAIAGIVYFSKTTKK